MIKQYFSNVFLFLIVFFTLGLTQSTQGQEYSSVFTKHEEKDLQLLKTYQDLPGLIAHIDHTHTKLGNLYLREQLVHPLTDIQQLRTRQKTIQAFLENQSLQQALKQKLQHFAQHEDSLVFFENTDNVIGSTVINDFYFKNNSLQWLNKHPLGLELGQAAHIANLAAPLIEHAVIHFLVSEKLHEYLGMCCGHSHHDHGHKKHKHHHAHQAPSVGATLAYNAYNVIHTAIHLIGFKGLIDHVKQQASVIQEMQIQLMQIRKCLESAYAVCDLLAKVAQPLIGFSELKLLQEKDPALSLELREFLTLITSNTFAGNPSFFSRQGIILRTYALAKNVMPELKEKLAAIAITDFYLSNATLYQEHQHTALPFTFANYLTQESPLISVQGFWNPLLREKKPIEQEITLGNNNPPIAIVTGPNKAGKSTSLGAIALIIVLAQTIGLAPAAQCQITPFSCVKTGFNMHNRIESDQSLFSASLDFAQTILKHTKSDRDHFVFIAVDELFNSTEFYQGSAIATRFVQELSTAKNCIALIATHFGSLTELESGDPTCYKNFKAELSVENNQSYYSLRPGISEADDALRLIDKDYLTLGIRFSS